VKRSVLGLAILLWTQGVVAQVAPKSPVPANSEIRRILEQWIGRRQGNVGVVVGVIAPAGRRIVASGSFDKDDPRPVDGNTIFEIGSISKVFTSLLLADMIRRGEVALADPVAMHLPKWVKVPGRGGRVITLEDLARHRSGLPRDMPIRRYVRNQKTPFFDDSVRDLYRFLSDYKLPRDIGSKAEYSNLGVGLLGHALSLAAGEDYGILIRTRITGPLKINSTGITIAPNQRPRLAPGHDDWLRPAPKFELAAAVEGAGALRSTANDMLSFLSAQLGETPSDLDPAIAATRANWQPAFPGQEIGLGWLKRTEKGSTIIWHNGGTWGHAAFAGFDPSAKTGVVILANVAHSMGNVDDIGFHLLNPGSQFFPPVFLPAIMLVMTAALILIACRKLGAARTESRTGDAIPAMRNEPLAPLFERLARKKPVRLFQRWMGLDSRQFLLFLGLFRTLSEREEFMGIPGVNRFRLSYAALFFALIGTLMWSFLAFKGMPAALILLLSLTISLLVVIPFVVREAANAMFNPVEASVLAHYPVHSLTYAAAKIAHVLIAVLYLVTALCVPPALVGVMLRGTHWYWPVTHLAAAFLTGITAAFLICALYGLIRRFLPASWLKGISIGIQLLPVVAIPYIWIYSPAYFFGPLTADFETGNWTWLPFTWFVEIGFLGFHGTSGRFGWAGALSIAISMLAIWFGIRSFSGTYFSEGASIAQGWSWRAPQKTALSRSYAALLRRVTGSPLGLGVFFFISKLMGRDWQFRRNILAMAVLPLLVILVMVLAIVQYGLPAPPLSSRELSPVYIIPHLLGLIMMGLCSVLPFTDFQSGAWIYLTAPVTNLRMFARGIYWALWVPWAGLPHFALLPFLIPLWGWKEASLATGFSLIVVSLYLGFSIKLIHGIPFSSPFDESRIDNTAFWMMGVICPISIHWALFRHWWIALPAGVILAVATWFVVRVSLGDLEEEIRWRLHQMKMGPNQMFKEVD
jgi:D-alanyl-D-alanine-carboxypeptidase/D-alanyl-D-alanine-endopeptidase